MYMYNHMYVHIYIYIHIYIYNVRGPRDDLDLGGGQAELRRQLRREGVRREAHLLLLCLVCLCVLLLCLLVYSLCVCFIVCLLSGARRAYVARSRYTVRDSCGDLTVVSPTILSENT